MNTMKDLRREVAQQLRETLHGRTVRPSICLEKMLGDIGMDESPPVEPDADSLLSHKNEFWDEWPWDVLTPYESREKVSTAVDTLIEDDIVNIVEVGTESRYVEVESMDEPSDTSIQTSCKECGTEFSTTPSLTQDNGYYHLRFSLNCPDCEFSRVFESNVQPL